MPRAAWIAACHAAILLAALLCISPTTAYRILSAANDPAGVTPAVFEPYVRGQVGYYGDPANPDPERVNEGSPFSPDQPRIFFQSSPKQNCPGMIGPVNEEEYYCRGREYGYCDRRSGLCVCNQGYTGLDCTDCKPSYFKKGSLCLPKKNCPKDCSRAGVCNHETGTCTCALNRRGDDCSQRYCSFDAKCTSCTSTQCLSCIEGFYVDPATQTCHLLLNSVRRSGARLVDAALPFDELTREFSFKFSYGSQDARVFDEAEAYQLVSPSTPALNTVSQSCTQGLRRDASWSCQPRAVSHKVCGHAGVFSWASPLYSIAEAATSITLTVRRSGGGLGDASVVYDIEHVSTNRGDVSPTMFYTSSQSLQFASGVVELSFSLTVHDDHVVDGDKAFRVRLRTPSDGSTLSNQRDTLVTILDDDLSQTDASLTFVMPPASAAVAALTDGGRAGDSLTFQIQAVLGNGAAKTSGGDVLVMESFVADELSSDTTQWLELFPFRPRRYGQITDQGNGKYLCSWQRDDVGNFTVAVWLLYAGGLQGDYYEDAWLSGGPLFSRIDRHVNFTWGNGPLFPGASDFVAVRWSGRVKPKATGDVTFFVDYDDHVRLWIGDVLLIDRWSSEHDGGGSSQAVMALDSTLYYSIVLQYRELTGNAGVKLQWSSASVPREEIPASNLFTAQHIRGSPFERIPITPALATAPSTSYIEGALTTVAGTPLQVTLFPVDGSGNARVQWDPSTDVYRGVLSVVTDRSLGAFGSKEVACDVTPSRDRRRFALSCVPFFSGTHALDVTVNGAKIFGSPFQVTVTPNAMHPSRSLLSGPGLTASRVAGVATTVALEARDLHGNRIFSGGMNAAGPVLEIRAFHTTRATAIETGSVADNGDGTYTLSYTPRVVGTYLVHVTQRGTHVHNSPYSVSVVPNQADGATSVAIGVSATGVTNVQGSFQLQSRDMHSNDLVVGSSPAATFQVVLEHAVKGNTSGACVDLLNGRYTCTYTPRFVGPSRLHVSLVRAATATATAIVGSPFDVQVAAGVALGSFCYAEGAALAASIAGQQTSFRVVIRDRFDNPKVNAGAENVSVTFSGPAPATTTLVPPTDVALSVAYLSDGVFLVSYTLTRKGQYSIRVLVDGVAIKGSPFGMYTSPATASPATTTIDLVAPTSDAISPLTYVAGEPVKTQITTRDAFGNVLDGGGYRFQFSDALAPPLTASDVALVDLGNGLYSFAFTPIAAREHALRPRLLLPGGLNATYFASPDLSGPEVLERVEPTVNVDFGVEPPTSTRLARTFSVRWLGMLLPAFSERYTFRAQVLGGLWLRVGNATVLDALWPEATSDRRQQASLFLVANTPVAIEIWFSKPAHLPNASVRITWQSLSQPEQELPADRLLTAWRFGNNVPPVQVVPADSDARSFTATFPAGATETAGPTDEETLTLWATAGERMVFHVTARDRFGNRRLTGGDRISVLFPQLPDDVQLFPDVQDAGNATYEVSFSPIRSGTFSMVVAATRVTTAIHAGTGVESLIRRLRPSLIQQSPFTLRVRPNRPLAETSTLVGEGTRHAVAGVSASFRVELRDLHGNRVDATGLAVPLRVVVRRLNSAGPSYDGVIGLATPDGIDITYTALASGQCEILLSVSHGPLVRKTTDVWVVPNVASALTSTASGAGLGPQVALQAVNSFEVVLRDEHQNELNAGGDGLALVLRGPAVVYGDALDLGNGRYSMQYALPLAGRYELTIVLANPGRGLVGSYFESTRYQRPASLSHSVSWVDARIDFDWRANQTMRNYPRVQWKGFLVPRFTETYTLQLLADPFGAVYVDGAPIVDLLHMSQTPPIQEGEVALVAGRLHRIVVEYRSPSSRDVAGRLQLQWRSARQPQEIIPADVLLPDGQQLQPRDYDPIQVGSIDGTDTTPHDRALRRALHARFDASADPQIQGDPFATLFVGRLSYATTEETLRDVFTVYGAIKCLRLVRDVVTQQSKGYAFIEFERERDFRRAYDQAHRHVIDGRAILVDYERSRVMAGWKPRRLGGGLGGKKESGQLRFGGRDHPFRGVFTGAISFLSSSRVVRWKDVQARRSAPDNRFMAQLGLGGGNDLMNPTGLDFSSMMMMGDTSSFSGSAATGMIDFPDDLNSPKNSSNVNANGMNGPVAATSTSLSTSVNATTTTSAPEAIPFPAALANDPSPASSAPSHSNPPTSTATSAATSMGLNTGFAGTNGLDLNGMSANLGLNMATMNAMNGGLAMGMNMGMNPGMNGFMPDMNMGMAAMNPIYFKIVRRPMDLNTIKKKLDAGIYKHMDQFAEDVRLTFNNAMLFNSEDQDVYNLAKDMLNDFNGEMRMLEAQSKCICMFQEIHGVSVLLFGMYVHEFDEQEAECNSRRVYISYLDSVNYFEPSHLRTKVYHELLIAYLEFVRQRGFHTAHLWACPPLKGDDYILYCHPESQKTPKSDRLRQWYVDMLTKAQSEGVVLHISNLYDEYWRNDNNACSLPYFEGDYWVGLAEEIIEKLDAEKPKKSKKGTKRKAGGEVKKLSKKSKSKKTKRRKTSSATSNGGPSGAENDVDNGTGSDAEMDAGDEDEEDMESADDQTPAEETKRERAITSLDDYDRTVSDPLMKKIGEVIEPMKDDFLVVKLQPYCRLCNKPVITGTLWKDPTTSTELGLNPKTVQVTLCDPCYQKAKSTTDNAALQGQLALLQPEPVTWPEKCADPDDVNDSEYFDTRQAFLSLCQGNHYQFDELRRAKHSSMMALYHLGNPNPNAYVYECNSCTRDIVSGNRWHCHVCPDFDVCDACNAKEKHEHPLEKIPTSGAAGPGGHGGQSGAHGSLTEEQRRLREQRAKNVRLHMQLLVHASGCDGSCGSGNCEKMKELMRHGAQCKQRALGGCTVCRRVWALLQLHARQCRQYECKVPRCHDLREHVRKLQLQQQLMDDRRRAAVTQQYRQMQNGQSGGDNGGDDDPVNGV
ncbi:hypothetical protein ATCC90586_007573 [Pythium insidiosum]|nr:hypothetical protein ATCC90586_007573 [Pythium insidiosum]